jgi:spore germination protein KC
MNGRESRPRRAVFGAVAVKLLLIASLLSMTALLAGCWDQRYLDRLGVVLALGVDTDPAGKQEMQITVQVVLPQNVASESMGTSGGTPVTTFTDTGDTVFEAIRKMSARTSRRLFFSHTQLLVIGEAMARKGIYPLVDMIERNPDIRTDISVLLTRGIKAQQLLQMTTQMENIPANQFHETLDVNANAYGTVYPVYVKDITRLRGRGQEQAVVPAIRIDGNPELGRTSDNVNQIPAAEVPVMSTMAVFKDGKLIDYLKPRESRGLSWLEDKVKSTIIKLACPQSEGFLSVEIHKSQANYKVKDTNDDDPLVQADLLLEGSIQEILCPGLDVLDERVLDHVGELACKEVEKEAGAAINRIQRQMKSDALGWGKEIYIHRGQSWKRLEKKWAELFPTVRSEVTCTTKIMGSGVRNESIVK